MLSFSTAQIFCWESSVGENISLCSGKSDYIKKHAGEDNNYYFLNLYFGGLKQFSYSYKLDMKPCFENQLSLSWFLFFGEVGFKISALMTMITLGDTCFVPIKLECPK